MRRSGAGEGRHLRSALLPWIAVRQRPGQVASRTPSPLWNFRATSAPCVAAHRQSPVPTRRRAGEAQAGLLVAEAIAGAARSAAAGSFVVLWRGAFRASGGHLGVRPPCAHDAFWIQAGGTWRQLARLHASRYPGWIVFERIGGAPRTAGRRATISPSATRRTAARRAATRQAATRRTATRRTATRRTAARRAAARRTATRVASRVRRYARAAPRTKQKANVHEKADKNAHDEDPPVSFRSSMIQARHSFGSAPNQRMLPSGSAIRIS